MSFLITGTGSRLANSFENASSDAPVLRATFDPGSVTVGTTCFLTERNKKIVDDKDDVAISGGSLKIDETSLTIGSGNDAVYLRFNELAVPRGVTIREAYLQVYAATDMDAASTIAIALEDSANSAGVVDAADLSSRVFLSPVNWTLSEEDSWATGSRYTSVDLSTQVSNIVSKSTWLSGNAMTLRLKTSSGTNRVISSFKDNNQILAAKLAIVFEDDGGDGVRTVKTELLEAVDSLNADGYTPVQDTYFEAYQYLAGKNVTWGKWRGGHRANGTWFGTKGVDGPHAYTRTSVRSSIQAGTYEIVRPAGCTLENPGATECASGSGASNRGEYLTGAPIYDTPIDNYCQADSHIIYLTDGLANENNSAELIKAINTDSEFVVDNANSVVTRGAISQCASSYTFTEIDGTEVNVNVNNDEACVIELADRMYTGDISPLQERQRVITHMIGFNFNSDWLRAVADAGGGLYREADSAEELVAEIQSILAQALKTDATFVAPVAAVNQFNRLNNESEVYFAVFRPEDTPSWDGNLKKYQLGRVDPNDPSSASNVILDARGLPAVNANTGFFEQTSVSLWATEADGDEVIAGGAGDEVPDYITRNLYSNVGLSNDLNAAENLITTTNANLTNTVMGLDGAATAAELTDMIEWVRGRDVDNKVPNDTDRYVIGDPLHSKPIAVTYGAPDPNTPPDATVFMGTNAGALHAFDAETGEEQFAFIPKELLSKQVVLRTDDRGRDHPYGLDGSPAVWIRDVGNDGIRPGTGDFVRLYVGMRRGGRSYYALDVTNRNDPQLMWQINGDTGEFSELGESWARPIIGQLKVGSTIKDVLYISGGYDDVHDSASTRITSGEGRAVFIVDALTGEKIWSGGNSSAFDKKFDAMQYAMPATITVADVDSDGLDDLMFIGDVGGQVWRFDIANGQPVTSLVSGGVIADLGVSTGTNDAINNRRFFHSPDVALVQRDDQFELAVTIGSGFRPSPLSTETLDQFFLIRQKAVFGPPVAIPTDPYPSVTLGNLFDATSNIIAEGTDEERNIAAGQLAAAEGWYLTLNRSGEKVLSTPLSFRDTVTFTTYEPTSRDDICNPKAGTSRVYQVNLNDATPTTNFNEVDGLDASDRAFQLDTGSIVDEPVIICTGDGCDVFAGAERPPIDPPSTGRITKTYWRKEK